MNQKFTQLLKSKILLATTALALSATAANAQCTISSSDNYMVSVFVTEINAVLNKTDALQCANGSGYNYGIHYSYNIFFSGTGTPILNTLQATFNCEFGQTLFFQLPLNGGTNNSITTGITAFSNKNDCATANLSSLQCTGPITLTIGGKGIGTPDPNSFGQVIVACNVIVPTPLPVKLLSFDAAIENNQVALLWSTATELNNAYFILERSTNGKDFTAITKMDGAGTSRVTNTYRYNDDMPTTGYNYYRLKQVDESGVATYSRVLAVESKAGASTAAIFPNPTNGNSIKINGLTNASDWNVKILNTSSAVVYQSVAAMEEINLTTIPSGLYFVHLQNNKTGASQVLKLMRN